MVSDWPPVPASDETTTLIVLVPPLAVIVPPLKLQVIRAGVPLVLQLQLVPLAETNVRPVGSWSLTCAVVALPVPLFVTVRV